jgi:hypothetical protein
MTRLRCLIRLLLDYSEPAHTAIRLIAGCQRISSSGDEWDEYEGRYCDAMMRYLATHPDDPDSAKFLKRMQDWHSSYLQWGRATLGFGYYLLVRT